MTIVNGYDDGKRVVLDEPVPATIAADTPARVIFKPATAKHVLAQIAELAVSTDDLPPDYTEQHEPYVKGTPRR